MNAVDQTNEIYLLTHYKSLSNFERSPKSLVSCNYKEPKGFIVCTTPCGNHFIVKSMKKTVLVLVAGVLCLHVNHAYSQRGDYIATDSSLSSGIKLEAGLPRFNSQYVVLKSKSGGTKYTPDQLKEYGFKDGTVYESKKILLDNEERNVFLERLAKGNITLYRYVDTNHRTYYLKKDSSDLLELDRDLGGMTALSQDCEFMTDAIKLASYTKGSLRKLISRYNKCENKPFPYKKIGILAGWRNLRLTQPSGLNTTLMDVSIPSSGSPLIGIFADIPIEMSEFTLHPELFYTWNNISANSHKSQFEVDVLINISTLQMPVLVRYTFPAVGWRLFANAGPYLSYNLKNSSDIYYSTIVDNKVTIQKPVQGNLMSDFMFGYSGGLGVQRQLNYRKTLSGEVRYMWATGTEDNTLIQQGMDLVIGFTF